MIGPIPTELGRLSNLKVLSLKSNNLTGTLPTEVGKLVNIKQLHLASNSLEGAIPSEIGHCAQLEQLEILINNMEGTIPKELFNCMHLQLLNMNFNSFTGSIPTEIGQLEELLRLHLQNNHLSGRIPSEIGNLSSLQQLWLAMNELTGSIPIELENLLRINFLVLADNKLTGTLPDIFDNFSELSTLGLSFNHFTGIIPNSIWKNNINEGVVLTGNELRGNVPDELCQKTKALKVDSSFWFIDEPKVKCGCCENITCYLWETSDPIVDGTLRPLCPNSNRHNISFFERYWIEDHVANITFQDRSSSQFTEVCLSPTGCYTLYDLHKTKLDYDLNYSESSKTLSMQGSCGAVDVCGVSFDINHPKREGLNHLTQIVMSDLSKLDDPESPEYKALCWIMTSDPLYDEFEICDGTLLQRFSVVLSTIRTLQRNGDLLENVFRIFEQHTCDWVGVACDPKRKYIEELDLKDRNFTGPIPQEFGFLTRLKRLKLSNNAFTGTIDPFLFSRMPHLEQIDFAENAIGGEIPQEIFMPPKLWAVNISNNLITGSLPTDIQYSANLGK